MSYTALINLSLFPAYAPYAVYLHIFVYGISSFAIMFFIIDYLKRVDSKFLIEALSAGAMWALIRLILDYIAIFINRYPYDIYIFRFFSYLLMIIFTASYGYLLHCKLEKSK